jgi:hypothetical protein
VGWGFAVPVLVAGVLTVLAALVAFAVLRRTHRALDDRGEGERCLRGISMLAFVIHFAFAALQATNAFYIQDLLEIDTMGARA